MPIPSLVATELRKAIWSGTLVPGQRLREANIASEFGVSRGSLRDALQTLERDGLVESVPRRGTFVRQISGADLQEIAEARLMLEEFAFTTVTERATDADLCQLKVSLREMDHAAKGGDWNAVLTCDLQFHRAVIELCRNRLISGYYAAMQSQLRLLFLQLPDGYLQRGQLLDEHQLLFNALQSHDPVAMQGLITAHLQDAELRFQRHIVAGSEKADQ
ncbi:MAG: GntR family transcriptional regulator [Candidatus Dormibacteria bacterium]